MKEILIINLTRMGDLLQTTPLMAGLRKRYPGAAITLLINSAFTEICNGIPFIDELIKFDMKGYRNRLIEGNYSLVENYRVLEDLIERINRKEYDLTINITHSPISAILTYFVRTKEIRGFTIDTEGHRIIKHPWMRYFFNVIPNRIYNPFHLVDMYLKMGDVRPGVKGLIYNVPADDEERAELFLKNEGVSKDDLLIGFHLGASKNEKTWPVSSYAALADMISSEYGARILLFGSPGETELAEQFEKYADVRPVNFIGKTSVGELAALLKNCRLFISNDTGPLHIATSVNTRVIDISTANVHFMETGPYGDGHYVVQADLACVPCGFDVKCHDPVCKSLIKPHSVFEVVRQALGEKGIDFMSGSPLWKDLQVYRSHFKDDGYIGFYPLIKHSLTKEILYRTIYRRVWNIGVKPLNGKAVGIYEDICREIHDYYELDNIRNIVHALKKEIAALAELVRLSEQGVKIISGIVEEAAKDNMDIRKIREIWQQIGPVDNEIELIGHTHPCFRPLTLIFRYTKEALEGSELKALAEATCAVYADLNSEAGNMLEIMKGVVSYIESAGKTEASPVVQGKTVN